MLRHHFLFSALMQVATPIVDLFIFLSQHGNLVVTRSFLFLLQFMSRFQNHVATVLSSNLVATSVFLVTTVSTQFSFFFWSQPRKCVATEWWSFLPCSCRSCTNLVTTCFNCSARFNVTTLTGVFSLYFCRNINFSDRDLVSSSSHPFLVATLIIYCDLSCLL